MRPELAAKLQETNYADFRGAVLTTLEQFEAEIKRTSNVMSDKDRTATQAFRSYLERGTSGEIARQDAKTILRDVYGPVGRFLSTLPRQIEALRNKPEFSAEALRRGDAQKPIDVTLLTRALEKVTVEKERLAKELDNLNKDYVASLSDTETARRETLLEKAKTQAIQGDYNALKYHYHELHQILVSKGIPLPKHLQEPEPVLERTTSACDFRRRSSKDSSSRQTSLSRRPSRSGADDLRISTTPWPAVFKPAPLVPPITPVIQPLTTPLGIQTLIIT